MSTLSPYLSAPGPPAQARTDRVWDSVARRLPLIVFVLVYLFSCYLGTLALLLSDQFRTVFLVFSGAHVPDLSARDVAMTLVLLHAGPLCLWGGYTLAMRYAGSQTFRSTPAPHDDVYGPRAVFVLAALVACISFTRVGAWAAFVSWFDYNAYIHARIQLFDQLTFFEFVNFYALLPVSACYLCLTERRRLPAVIAVAVTLVLQAGLAQRRILLLTAILIGVAIYLYRFAGERPRKAASRSVHARIAASGAIVLYVLYAVLTITTIVRPQSKPFDETQKVAAASARPHQPRGWVHFTLDPAATDRIQRVRLRSIALYVLMSPLTRTSISAVAYPAVFPAILPYYDLDLGLDILGVGTMPDDNIKVYSVLWPQHLKGAIAAPAQYVFYSQGGLVVACVLTLIVGAVLALLWRTAVSRDQVHPHHALWGAVVIIVAMTLTMDSARNVFVVSYGALWEFASIAVLVFSARCTAFITLATAQLTSAR